MNEELQKVKEKLKKYHQEHLLMKYDEKTEEEKKELLNQIENPTNREKIMKIFFGFSVRSIPATEKNHLFIM